MQRNLKNIVKQWAQSHSVTIPEPRWFNFSSCYWLWQWYESGEPIYLKVFIIRNMFSLIILVSFIPTHTYAGSVTPSPVLSPKHTHTVRKYECCLSDPFCLGILVLQYSCVLLWTSETYKSSQHQHTHTSSLGSLDMSRLFMLPWLHCGRDLICRTPN